MNKIYLTNTDIQKYVSTIVSQLYKDNWRPDYIVGITRGGLTPSVMLSQFTGIKMHTLDVRLRDGDEKESNLWMADDAQAGKNILVLDDINDTGATFNWIMEDWDVSHDYPDEKTNVRFAVLLAQRLTKQKILVGLFSPGKSGGKLCFMNNTKTG